MLNGTDKIIFELIRKALDGEYQVETSIFADANWTDVIEEAIEQGVLGICFDAMELLPEPCRPDMYNLMECLGQVEYQAAVYEEHRKIIGELAHFYERRGIRMMLLKGYGLSLYWPEPEHRPVGDIDIYLFGQWEKGDRLIREKLGVEVEEGHEHHTTFTYKGMMVENHYDFINTKAHKDAPVIEARLKELASVDLKRHEFPDGSCVYFPSADFNVVFLVRHLGQHFAGERITLRQLMDWCLFLREEGGNVHWNEIVPFLKKIGIWKFFNQVNAVSEDYLGVKFTADIPVMERDRNLETRILEDILHPEFSGKKPKKLLPVLWFKARRWYCNRWKHPLVYDEWWLPMFLTLLWSHLRRIETIKD